MFGAVLRSLTCPIWPFPLSPLPAAPQLHSAGQPGALSPEYEHPQMGSISGLGVSNFTFLQVSPCLNFERRKSILFCSTTHVWRGMSSDSFPTGSLRSWGLLGSAMLGYPQADPVPCIRFSDGLGNSLQAFYSAFCEDQRILHKTLGIWSRIYFFNF